ncbi:hypothetical protein ACFPZ0_05005 [Streptomonospora nanhaiensis]|uniref:hypothetical protein n=1 Tax=Streptomonospora nanhaiensis TaxID=1323731 RepID=UPI001C387E51|nr:hypothetical protein [Streptomonospora nanhaiensis]MBV2364007.1 hypothetical protein [Streptomonospora nanhaiensis]MBX9387351.1 hypothetical protein [Streptomonospora nanhaiensis]
MSLLWRAVAAEPGARPWSAALRGTEEWLSFPARLPSTDEGLWFSAEFELALRITSRSRIRRQSAASEVRTRVVEFSGHVARTFSVADFGLAEAEVSRRLLEDEIVHDPEIAFGSIAVRVTADPEDIELVKLRERCGPRSTIQAEEHRSQMRHLQRLTEDVYSDPAVALRWWFDRNPERVHDLATAAGQLRLVLDEVKNDTIPGVEAAGTAVSELLSGLDHRDRALVIDRLSLLLSGFGRRDLAKRLMEEGEEEEEGTTRGGPR